MAEDTLPQWFCYKICHWNNPGLVGFSKIVQEANSSEIGHRGRVKGRDPMMKIHQWKGPGANKAAVS